MKRIAGLLLLALLLCAAVAEPETPRCSDDYATDDPAQPQGYFDGGSL